MCVDLDLFGQVIITYSDVALWLENSRLSPDTIPTRVKAYIKDYDLSRKIAQAKLSGDFYKIENIRKEFDLGIIKEALQPEPKPPKHPITGCPLNFHVCKNKSCDIYKLIKQRVKRQARHKAKTAQSKKWLADMKNILPAAA
jgi:hypothetical protein